MFGLSAVLGVKTYVAIEVASLVIDVLVIRHVRNKLQERKFGRSLVTISIS